MKLFHKLIRAIERNSRNNERRKLVNELGWLYIDGLQKSPRVAQIVARLDVLGKADLDAYLNRDEPVKSVSQSIKEESARRPIIEIIEDDATPAHHWHGYVNIRPTMDYDAPEGLAGQWKAPV